MANNWFNHPSKQTVWLVTIIFILATICILLASTNLFTEQFDRDFSTLAALNLSAGWAVAKIWANYLKQQKKA